MRRLAFDVNTLWFYVMIAHLVGSVVFGMFGVFTLGSFIFISGIWIFALVAGERTRRNVGIILIGWALSLILLLFMDGSYRDSFLLNGLTFLLVWCVCSQRKIRLQDFCCIKPIPVKQWWVLLVMTPICLILAYYVNALSMLLFVNTTAVTLAVSGSFLWESIVVYALLPAVVEEALFRGCIFRGIKSKKTAIIVSSVVFALLHMNFNQMCYALVMGLLFAVLVVLTDNLSFTIIIHMLFNLFNVLVSGFPNNPVAAALLKFQIGGYHPFHSSFSGSVGGVNGTMILFGTLFVVLVLVIALLLLRFIRDRLNPKKIAPENQWAAGAWHPNAQFWVGCVVCVVVAIFYEILL